VNTTCLALFGVHIDVAEYVPNADGEQIPEDAPIELVNVLIQQRRGRHRIGGNEHDHHRQEHAQVPALQAGRTFARALKTPTIRRIMTIFGPRYELDMCILKASMKYGTSAMHMSRRATGNVAADRGAIAWIFGRTTRHRSNRLICLQLHPAAMTTGARRRTQI
jgi:hypothetical protein